jgi:hypothetical protein
VGCGHFEVGLDDEKNEEIKIPKLCAHFVFIQEKKKI